jgi:hypothetical protein
LGIDVRSWRGIEVTSSMKKTEVAVYTALAAYTIVLGSHLVRFGYELFQEPDLFPVAVPWMLIEVFGISLVWFLLRGHDWARYATAVFASLCLCVVLLLPFAAHGIDRTVLFACCIFGAFLAFCYLDYLLIFHENTSEFLKSRRDRRTIRREGPKTPE